MSKSSKAARKDTVVSQRRNLIGLVLSLICFSPFAMGQPAKNSPARVEFRLAETEPQTGLIEATVPGTERKIYLHREAIVTNKDISAAQAIDNGRIGYSIEVTFTEEGAKKMEAATKDYEDKRLAILVDGKLVHTSILVDSISKKLQMTGFTKKDAENIVEILKLPSDARK
jgi:preprotein translocase subunit SecD